MGIVHIKNTSCRLEVPVPQGLAFTGAGAVAVRSATGEWGLSLPTTATAYIVSFPLTAVEPYVTNLVNPSGGVADPFGFRIEQIYLWYLIGAVNATANNFTIMEENMASGAARAAATGFNGNANLAITNNGVAGTSQPAATGVTGVAAFSANMNLSIITLSAPIYFSNDQRFVTAEWGITTGSGGTATIARIMLAGTLALEG